MSTATDRDRAIALLERYLSKGCTVTDPLSIEAWKLGGALSMLASLMNLYEGARPEAMRQMFDQWRAEQARQQAGPPP